MLLNILYPDSLRQIEFFASSTGYNAMMSLNILYVDSLGQIEFLADVAEC